MSGKTIKTSSAGGGGQQVQDASIKARVSRHENGVTLAAAASHLFNGVTETGAGGFSNIGEGMANSRPSPTSNSSTSEDRRHPSAGGDGGGATACSYVYERQQPPQKPVSLRTSGGSASRFTDSRTTPIVRLLFYRTFTEANLDEDVIRRLDIEPIVRKLSTQEHSFVQDTCEKYLEYLGSSEKVSIDSHRRALETAGWEVSDNNVDAEFKKVVNQTFDEEVTWGNVIGFLGFALGFSIFIHNKGMRRAVISVAEWTKQVIEEDIGKFFIDNRGWVSY